MEQLLPCPFCGSTDVTEAESKMEDSVTGIPKRAVFCENCLMEGPLVRGGPEDAVAAWNARPSPPVGTPSGEDMAMLIRRLCRRLDQSSPGNTLTKQAMDYLNRHGLSGSPLRAAPPVGTGETLDVAEAWKAATFYPEDQIEKACAQQKRAAELPNWEGFSPEALRTLMWARNLLQQFGALFGGLNIANAARAYRSALSEAAALRARLEAFEKAPVVAWATKGGSVTSNPHPKLRAVHGYTIPLIARPPAGARTPHKDETGSRDAK